ncbi:MAG TPA: ABC transporter ATP-binding protein [Clostridiales bacterium]|jgi:energy-coupling factor transport system ATP-binding protein|nr:ABC transporter ATP-binding protein [Clostridiales bacterium]
MKPIIEVKGYSFVYENTTKKVLDNVSFVINEGDFVGIIGRNRSGKSTLCESLVGILPFVMGGSWEGEIIVDGKSLNDTKGAGATDVIGIVFQDAESQFTQETVEDEISFAMCNFGYSRELMRERILYASEACGLRDMLDRSPFKLSGGQQQRLAIACILALQPRVIVLDESTSQLDPVGRDEVFNLITKLHAAGSTVIMVDHNIEKIAEYVNKVLVLYEGKVVEFDETHKVFQNKEKLNAHNVRIPQITDAALQLKDQLEITEAPIRMEEAKLVFDRYKREVGIK